MTYTRVTHSSPFSDGSATDLTVLLGAMATGLEAAETTIAALPNTYHPVGLLPDARSLPPRPAETIITTFQSGHGWTQSGVGTSTLNDTTTFTIGTQSISGTTAGTGTSFYCNLNSPTFTTPLDLTRKYLKLLLRVPANTNLSQIAIYASSDAGFTNFYAFPFTSGSGGDEVLIAGDWVEVTCPFNSTHMSITGSPTRSSITNLRIGIRDTGAGTQTANIQKVSVLDEPYDVWPNGLVSFDFDDGYASHATVAGPYLAQYGWSGTSYPICNVLGTGTFMSISQLQALQHDLGWATGLHAYTQANHDAGLTTLSSAAQQIELRSAKQFMIANGLRADYMAYPRGMFDDTLISNVRQLSATGRTTYRRYGESWPPAEPYRIRAISILASDTLASIKSEIDAAVAGRYWIILIFHDLVTSGATVNQWLQSDFKSLVDYVALSNAAVANIDQVMKARSAPSGSLGILERDLASGQETFPRLLAATPNTPGTGTMRLTYFTARKTEKVSSIRCYTGASVGSGITLSRVGLYSVAADGSLTLIGSSANDTAYLSAASTTYTKALSAAVQVYVGQRYAIGPLTVATTTTNVYGLPATPTNELSQAPRITGAVTGQADLPSTVASGSVTTSGFAFYFALIP